MFICDLQTILDLQLEGDSKLAVLRLKGEHVCAHSELEDSQKNSIQQALDDVQEKWRMMLEIAQELREQAELQDSLSKELQAFQSQQGTVQVWVEKLKEDLDSLGTSTHGSQDQIEERLSKAQVSGRDNVSKLS